MSIATLPTEDVFRSDPIRGLPTTSRVDRKAGKIFGAKAMQFGPLNASDSRPWKVDQTTLSQLVDLTNARNVGTKIRFSHPNMSQDGMGRHLGRATNARVVGEGTDAYAAIDISLSDAAKRTPNGNLFEHVLDLAEQSPEDFGLSIAPILDREAMKKMEPDANGLVPIRLKSLRAIDVVDEPAATRGGLFSIDSDSLADLPAQVTWLLETHFGDSPADVIRGRFDQFLATYFRTRGEPMTTAAPDHAAELATLKAENEALKKTNAELSAKATPAPVVVVDENAAAKAELSRRSEISALCQLAKVSDADRDLMLAAGFSRAEAQDYLKSSGRLSSANPPVSEGGANDPASGKKPTQEEQFAAEYEQFASIYARQGLSKEAYVKSRMRDVSAAK